MLEEKERQFLESALNSQQRDMKRFSIFGPKFFLLQVKGKKNIFLKTKKKIGKKMKIKNRFVSLYAEFNANFKTVFFF